MASISQSSLFHWDQIDASDDLQRLRYVMEALPDEALMRLLEARRGRGRDDYPVRPMWNSVIAGIVFQHVSIESLRRELQRNASLRQLCGFDPFGRGGVRADGVGVLTFSSFADGLSGPGAGDVRRVGDEVVAVAA
jgi:hypothetical protein